MVWLLLFILTFNGIPKPSTIWASHSPCLACSRSLILEYGKPETIKPTLRLATIDLGSSLLDTVNSLKCMAKLVHLNITILSWDWTEIRNNVHRAECVQSIDTVQQNLGFTYSQNEVWKLIEFINELSHNPQVSTWCELFSPLIMNFLPITIYSIIISTQSYPAIFFYERREWRNLHTILHTLHRLFRKWFSDQATCLTNLVLVLDDLSYSFNASAI